MSRSLAVEPFGDPCRGQHGAQVRLKGQWLRALGFEPGARVAITSPTPGTLQLTLETASTSADYHAALAALKHVLQT